MDKLNENGIAVPGSCSEDIISLSDEECKDISIELEQVRKLNHSNLKNDLKNIPFSKSVKNIYLFIFISSIIIVLTSLLIYNIFFKSGDIFITHKVSNVTDEIEAKIFQLLKAETQVLLRSKDKEIRKNQESINEHREIINRIPLENQKRLQEYEQNLKENLARDIKNETQRIENLGLTKDNSNELLIKFVLNKEREIQNLVTKYRAELEQASQIQLKKEITILNEAELLLMNLSKERKQLIKTISEYENINSQSEVSDIRLKTTETIELSKLVKEQSEEQILLNQVAGLIKSVRESLIKGEWDLMQSILGSLLETITHWPTSKNISFDYFKDEMKLLNEISLSIIKNKKSEIDFNNRENNSRSSLSESFLLREKIYKAIDTFEMAENFFNQGQYTTSINKFTEAFSNLGFQYLISKDFILRWVVYGKRNALTEEVRKQTQSSDSIFSRANKLIETDPITVRNLLIKMLSDYPLSRFNAKAVSMLASIPSLPPSNQDSKIIEEQIKELEEKIKGKRNSGFKSLIEQENEDLTQQISTLIATIKESSNQAKSHTKDHLPEDISKLRQRIDEESEEISKVQVQLSNILKSNSILEEELVSIRENARHLKEMRISFIDLIANYQADNFKSILIKKQYLDRFLELVSTKDRFSGLNFQIERLIEESKFLGQAASLKKAIIILKEFYSDPSISNKKILIRRYKNLYLNEPSMLEFLNILEDLLIN